MKKHLMIIGLILCIIFTCSFTENQKVYDDADLLTETEEQELQSACIETAKEKGVDIFVVTTDNTKGKSSMTYSDDFLDKKYLNDEADKTSILLLINMQDREVWINTIGEAITYFTDVRIDRMLDEITPYLSSASYKAACDEFLYQVELYMGVEAVGDDYYYNDGDLDDTIYYERSARDVFEDNLPIYLIVAVIAGVIGAIVLVSGSSKGMTAGAFTYMDKNSVRVHKEKDQYIRTTTTKRKIETPSNNSGGGGGGSSTHTSSSGVSHGGGGRSF